MSPEDLAAFRARLGWSRNELARRLGMSLSRLAEYEAGQTRSKPRRPAPIPQHVELALRQLEETARPLTPEEKAKLWREFTDKLPKVDHVIDDSREAIYDKPRL